MVLPKVDKIWMDGALVDWDEAQVHVLSHALHYGSGVFEGIRCYETPDGPAVFRLTEHMERFERSARMLLMDLDYSVEQTRSRPSRRRSASTVSTRATSARWRFAATASWDSIRCPRPINVIIAVWPWDTYLGEDALKHGVDGRRLELAPARHQLHPAGDQGDRATT